MRIPLGQDYFEARKGIKKEVVLDTDRLINAHCLIVGASGVGKSHTLREMITKACQSDKNLRVHLFDPHGDLEIKGASVAQFSEQADFGMQPFRVNPDPHFGGVRKTIQSFIRTVNQAASTGLGVKQEAVIRNLLTDVFKNFGFDIDDASTWALNELDTYALGSGSSNRIYLEVPLAEKDKAKAYGARWDPAKMHWWCHSENYKGELTKWRPAFKPRIYPQIKDLLEYAREIHLEKFLGSDQRAIRALHSLNKCARILQKKLLDQAKAGHMGLGSDDLESLEKARENAISAYTNYVTSIQTGLELQKLINYDSPEVLKSVVDRLENLHGTGIFKATQPPFDPNAQVWRYKLNALSHEEKKMTVLFQLQELFNKAVQRGEQKRVTELIVLDELSTYTSAQDEKGEGIIGVIAREARKFGQGLIACNQSPQGVPESLIASAGTQIILGLSELHWNMAINKLKVDQKLLQWIQPQQTMAVQLKEKGMLKNRWWWTNIN